MGTNFVVFSQNHDQIGNRMLGERLHQLVDIRKAKLAAALTLLTHTFHFYLWERSLSCKILFIFH